MDEMPTTESELVEFLMEQVETATVEDGCALDVMMRTFADSGVMTSNEGIVFRFPNGAEFQVTVVQSREAR